MANPKFSKVGNTYTDVEFASGRTIESGNDLTPNQMKIMTGGGHVQVIDNGENEHIIHANFLNVTPTIYTKLVNFLKDPTVRWSGKTFTFTDENAEKYTVRYWGEVLSDKPHANTNVDLEIPLRVEI